MLKSDKSLHKLEAAFHALSDSTRLKIIERLRDGEQCVCDLTDHLEAAQSRLSFHLKTLKDAGILQDRKEGRWVYYSLNADVLEEIREALSDLQYHAQRARRCCD